MICVIEGFVDILARALFAKGQGLCWLGAEQSHWVYILEAHRGIALGLKSKEQVLAQLLYKQRSQLLWEQAK